MLFNGAPEQNFPRKMPADYVRAEVAVPAGSEARRSIAPWSSAHAPASGRKRPPPPECFHPLGIQASTDNANADTVRTPHFIRSGVVPLSY